MRNSKRRKDNEDDIDFKKFAASGDISRDQLLYRLAKVVNKQRAVIGFLSILIFINFLMDFFQW